MKKLLALLLSLNLLIFCACNEKAQDHNKDTENNEIEIMSEITETAEIDTSGMDLDFTENDKITSYNENSIKKFDAQEKIEIDSDGIFEISGKCGQLIISAPDTAKPKIILNNAELYCENGPAIYVESADKVFITLKENTENTLSDKNQYDTSYGNADGVIFSKSDITINGNGKLTVNGNYKCGIVSKDDLNIVNANINVTSVGTAIEGKDCVKLSNSTIKIKTSGDGIKSTNTEDGTRGFVLIDSGEFDITSVNDAIQSQTALFIKDGTFNIESGGGAQNNSADYGRPDNRWGMWGENTNSTDTESAKALKSASLIEISGGEFTINSSDDALHSNCDLEISGGKFNITSGDDGIHADDQLLISGGEIVITKSYEGIEATAITVSGGNINVTASDDGFNSAGGNDSSALGGRPGQNPFESDSDAQLNFTGGYILVNVSGDGLDSNGALNVSGGTILVSGPTNSGNGALDYGGSATISGGTVVIVGASGMATTFGNNSSQASFMHNINSAFDGGTAVSLLDGNDVIASFTPQKAYNSIIISSPKMEIGKTYTLSIGGTVTNTDSNGFTESGKVSGSTETFEIEQTAVSVSNGGGMGNGMMPHGNGGGKGGRPF